MKRLLRIASLAALSLLPLALAAQFHRAEQDREITYWLLDPATHQFFISHDFTVSRPGQKYVHSFVRKGSVVAPDSRIFDLDTGKELKTYIVSGKDVNALGYYPTPTDPDSVVVQGELDRPIPEGVPAGAGQSVRVRVQETYTDPVGYTVANGELVWRRTLGRAVNFVHLPPGWMLTSVDVPAVISLVDPLQANVGSIGRPSAPGSASANSAQVSGAASSAASSSEKLVLLRFTNTRNDELSIELHARPRPPAP